MAKKTFTDTSLSTLISEIKSYINTKLATKAPTSHNHAASNINSGTLSTDRLPTVPVSKGGTGSTTASGALTNLGITATASELNKLDGVTATTTEINYIDGVTSNIQTQLNGKAASGHTHSYLPLSGGKLTSASFGALDITRSGSTNGASISFSNSNGTLGYIGMTGGVNGGLMRYSADTNSSYTVLDSNNYTGYAAKASHNHAATNITSGTLSSDRLPTISIAKGGTGATTAASALVNLGLTATASELNKLDGVTATTAEINYIDGVTSNIQTQLNDKLSLSGGTLTGSLIVNGNTKTPFYTNGDLNLVNKKVAWNAASYLDHVVLLLPVLTSSNYSGTNYFEGRFLFWKTGSNIYDVVDVSLNCCYNQLKYNLQFFGDNPSWKLCVCTYGGVSYYALKCPYHANPYTNAEFMGHVKSNLTGGTGTVALPIDVPYYNQNTSTVLNSEVKNSITETLTTTYVTSVVKYEMYNNGGFNGALNGNATTATTATKLGTNAGSATQPVYFSGGKPVATTYTLGKSVPSDAKFTDTTYGVVTTSANGLMSSTDKTKLDGIATGANKYTLPAAGSDLGGVKTGGDVTISSGVITVNDDSHNHTIANVDGLQTALDGKSATSHNHDSAYAVKKSQMTNDNGSSALSIYRDDGKNVLTEIEGLSTGIYTIYAQSGTAGNPKTTEAWRYVVHLTSSKVGWVQAYGSIGSVYTNYIDGNTGWRGWKCIWDNSPDPLWSGAMYMSSTNSVPQVVTPSKKLSECRNGWLLLWSDYDAGVGANDADFVTTMIPKRNPTGGTWGGKSFLCDIPRWVGSDTDDVSTEKRIIKPIYVHDDCIKGSYQNASGTRNDVVLRAVYEY